MLNAEIIWCLLGIAMLLCELFVPGFVILFFGLGALVVSLVCFMMHISINAQLLIFLVSSILMLLVFRKWFMSIYCGFKSRQKMSQLNIDSNIGEKAIVIEEIAPDKEGKIEFHGSPWKARSDEDIPAGTTVEITRQDNITFEVKTIRKQGAEK